MTRKALVVDDNAALAENIGEILEDEGFEVRVARDPFEALRMADAEPPDVALLDVRMPGMDGVTLHGELRKRAPNATFVLMTAYAADERLDAARGAGIRHVFPKPIPIEPLLAALRDEHGTTERVLVIEDDAALRDALADLLRAGGRGVDLAGTLNEARSLLGTRAYGSIVLDVRLPDGNGIEFAKEAASSGASIVLITGYEIEENARRLLDAPGDGSVALLQKPFDPSRLVEVVRTLEVRG